MAKGYIRKETPVDHLELVNTTGAALEAGELAVIEGFVGIADQAIEAGAAGTFAVAEGLQFESKDLKGNQDTFSTLGQDVFWDKTSKQFSNTTAATKFRVGYITQVKNDQGVIVIDKLRHAQSMA